MRRALYRGSLQPRPAHVLGADPGLPPLGPPSLHSAARDLASLLLGEAFPPGLAALRSADLPALATERDRVGILPLCHGGVSISYKKRFLECLDNENRFSYRRGLMSTL